MVQKKLVCRAIGIVSSLLNKSVTNPNNSDKWSTLSIEKLKYSPKYLKVLPIPTAEKIAWFINREAELCRF